MIAAATQRCLCARRGIQWFGVAASLVVLALAIASVLMIVALVKYEKGREDSIELTACTVTGCATQEQLCYDYGCGFWLCQTDASSCPTTFVTLVTTNYSAVAAKRVYNAPDLSCDNILDFGTVHPCYYRHGRIDSTLTLNRSQFDVSLGGVLALIVLFYAFGIVFLVAICWTAVGTFCARPDPAQQFIDA